MEASPLPHDAPADREEERHKERKEKKHKHKDKDRKEKKHKSKEHKRHKERRHRDKSPSGRASSDDEAGPEAEAAEAEAAADAPAAAAPAVPEEAGPAAGAEAPAPADSLLAGAAKPAAAAVDAAAAGAEDAEEGELPAEAAPPRDSGREERRDSGRQLEQRTDRSRRSRSRSPTDRRPSENGEAAAAAGERGGASRRERSRERERGGGSRRSRSRSAERSHRDRSWDGRPSSGRERERDGSRLRSRSAERRRGGSRSPPRHRPGSRSPDRRQAAPAGRDRSRSPGGRRDRERAPPLPPRDNRDYRRDIDRRDQDRRPDYGRDRYGGGPGVRFDDRRRYDRRGRSRSRSRSRDTRKRSRSDERRQRRDSGRQREEEEDEEEFQRRVAAALEQQQAAAEDEDRLIEERRRRRAEILAKHRSQQSLDQMATAPTATELAQQQQQQQQQQAAAAGEGPAAAAAGGEGQPQQGAAPPAAADASGPPSAQATPSRRPGSAAADAEAGAEDGAVAAAGGDEGEPDDLSDNEEAVMAQLGTTQAGMLDIFRHDGGSAGGEAPPAAPSELPKSGVGEALDTELGRRLEARKQAEPDMFAEDDGVDDIFAATPTDVKEKEAAAAAAQAGAAVAAGAARKGLLDNYDDAEGYYNFQVGELIGGDGQEQYEVYATHGKGVFSSVLRARDLARRNHDTGAYPEVAIKVIRANETMYKAGQMERVILRKLSEADPEGKRHCIRMLGSFEYRNHLCLVFEAMDMNLRELTKRYGRGIGLSINAVRVYAQQMLVALYHLKNCGVLHADIKPDNILVNDRRTVVKLCDFGSAMFSGDNEITPYLVSRFYRAPEVILGLPYEYPMDMWSIGCVVYELFTGHILFPGKTNNEMLKLMMDVKGAFPKKFYQGRAEFAFKHFEADPNMSFALLEEDPVTKRPVRRLIPNPTVKKDFGALLAGQSPDRRKLAQLVDLLERMMVLDPDKRISPKDALRHPFIKEPPSSK